METISEETTITEETTDEITMEKTTVTEESTEEITMEKNTEQTTVSEEITEETTGTEKYTTAEGITVKTPKEISTDIGEINKETKNITETEEITEESRAMEEITEKTTETEEITEESVTKEHTEGEGITVKTTKEKSMYYIGETTEETTAKIETTSTIEITEATGTGEITEKTTETEEITEETTEDEETTEAEETTEMEKITAKTISVEEIAEETTEPEESTEETTETEEVTEETTTEQEATEVEEKTKYMGETTQGRTIEEETTKMEDFTEETTLSQETAESEEISFETTETEKTTETKKTTEQTTETTETTEMDTQTSTEETNAATRTTEAGETTFETITEETTEWTKHIIYKHTDNIQTDKGITTKKITIPEINTRITEITTQNPRIAQEEITTKMTTYTSIETGTSTEMTEISTETDIPTTGITETETPTEMAEIPIEIDKYTMETTETPTVSTEMFAIETTKTPSESTEMLPIETTEKSIESTEIPMETTETTMESTETLAIETTEKSIESTEIPMETTETPIESTETLAIETPTESMIMYAIETTEITEISPVETTEVYPETKGTPREITEIPVMTDKSEIPSDNIKLVTETTQNPENNLNETIASTSIDNTVTTEILTTIPYEKQFTTSEKNILITTLPTSDNITNIPFTEHEVTTEESISTTILSESQELTISTEDMSTLPTIFQVLPEENETEIYNICSDSEIPIGIPNIKTLLETADIRVSKKSLDTVIKFFENDTVNKLIDFYSKETLTKSEMLSKILIFIKSTYSNLESHILEAIDDVLLHIEFTGKGAEDVEYVIICVNKSDIQEKWTKSSQIVANISKESMVSIANSETKLPFLFQDDKCVGQEVKVVIPNIQSLLTAADNVSNSTLQTIINFFHRKDIRHVFYDFHVEHETRSKLLADVLKYVIKSYKNVKPHVLEAFNQVLIHIKPAKQKVLKSDLIATYVCRPTSAQTLENQITPSIKTVISPKETVKQEHTTVELSTISTTFEGTIVETTTSISEPTHVKPSSEVFSFPLQPEDQDFHFENLEDYECPDNQIAVILPNTTSLLKAVKPSISKQSLQTVLDFFQKSNLAKLLDGVRIRQYESRAALLSEILSFIMIRYDDVLEPRILNAIKDMLYNIDSEGEGALQPDFTVICQDIEEITTSQPTFSTSVPHFITIPSYKIKKQPRITPEFAPTVATFSHTEYPSKISEETTINLLTETETMTLTPYITPTLKDITTISDIFTENELESTTMMHTENELESTTITQCSEDQVMIKVPNIQLLLQLINKNVKNGIITKVVNLFKRGDLLKILRNFNTDKYNKRAKLLSDILIFVKDHYGRLDHTQVKVIDEIIELLSHTQFENSEVLQSDFNYICMNITKLHKTTTEFANISTYETTTISTFSDQITTPETSLDLFLTFKDKSQIQNVSYKGEAKETENETVPLLSTSQTCPEPNTTQMPTINFPSLFEAIDNNVSKTTKQNIIKEIDTIEIQTELKTLKWNNYKSKGQLLKNILLYLISNKELTYKDELIKILPHVKMNGSGADPPNFKFICVPNDKLLSKIQTLQREPIIKIHSQENCEQDPLHKSVYIINIPSLLEAIKPTAPMLEKTQIAHMLQGDNISDILNNFDVRKYESKGRLLKAILTYLSFQSTLTPDEVENINTILCYISLVGPGGMPPNIKVECATGLDTSNIIIPKECDLSGSMPTLIVDIPTLLEVIDKNHATKQTLNIVQSVLENSKIQNHFLNVYKDIYESRSKTLKELLNYARCEHSKDENIVNAINEIMDHISEDNIGNLQTIIKFICKEDVSTICGLNSDGNAIAPIQVFNATKLFQALSQNVSEKHKDTVWKYMTKSNFYKNIEGFNILDFKTQGTLLKGILKYLIMKPIKQENLNAAITNLIKHVQLEGPGKEKVKISIECNISAPINIEIQKVHKHSMANTLSNFSNLLESSYQDVSGSTSPPNKCLEKHLFALYSIDVPSLFEAFKSNVSKILLKNLMEIIDTPSMQLKLKSLSWDKYNSKSELLKDVLSYVKFNTTQSKEVVNAISKVISQIEEHGTGAQYPNFKYICIPSMQISILGYLNEPAIIIPIQGECTTESNEQGNLVMVIDIQSLFKSLKPSTPIVSRSIVMAFFQMPEFEHLINDFRIDDYKTRGELLQAMISFLVAKEELDPNVQIEMKIVLDNVQLDGEGALPPVINIICKSKDIEKPKQLSNCEDLHSDTMVIPSPYPDNQTLNGMFIVDFPTLFTALDPNAPLELLPEIENAAQRSDIRLKLMDFDWNIYETRSDLLRDILLLIYENMPKGSKAQEAVDKLLPYILTSEYGTKPPIIKFEFEMEHEKHTSNILNECGQGIKPLYLIKISSLFKFINPEVSQTHKNLVAKSLGRFDLYKKIRDFKLDDYNTKDEFLQGLLAHLLIENSLYSDLMKAISVLILNITTNKCANNEMILETVCNVAVPERMSEDPQCQSKIRSGSEEHHLQDVNPPSVQILSTCLDNGTTKIIGVNVSQLVHDIQLPGSFADLLEEDKVQETLVKFDWDIIINPQDNKTGLLVKILKLLLKKLSQDYKSYTVLEKTLSSLSPQEMYKDVPTFTRICLSQEKFIRDKNATDLKQKFQPNLTNVNLLNEITDGPAVMKPTGGKCDNGATPILTVNTASLFESLKPNTPPLAKSLVSAYLSRPMFYKNLKNFRLASFETRGKQLQGLLIHLMAYTGRDTALMKAINTLLPNIQLEGPEKLKPSMKVICNITLNKIMQLPFTEYKFKVPISEAVKKSVLTPCIMSASGITYQINLPTIFYALEAKAPRASISTIIEHLTKPEFHSVLNGFDIESHKTNGDLLKSLLMFLAKKFENEHNIVQAVQNILPFVSSGGSGAGTPKIIPNCTLQDISGISITIGKTQFPAQGPKLVDINENNGNFDQEKRGLINEIRSKIKYDGKGALLPSVSLLCSPISINSNNEYLTFSTNDTCYLPNEFSISGMQYDLQIESLLQALKPDIPEQINNTLNTFFNNNYFQIHLLGFNIFGFKTRSEMLRNLLLFLASKPHIHTKFKKAMISSIPYVSIDGIGALAPVITTICPENQKTYFSPAITNVTDTDICKSPKAIKTTKLNLSIFQALDDTKPKEALKVMTDLIKNQDIMLTKLYKFDYGKYKTKGELLQALLAYVWSHPKSHKFEKEAAKALIPHVIFNDKGEEPPEIEESCYIPNETIKFDKEMGIQPLTLVYPTNKTCLDNVKNSPGIIVYRIEIPSLFRALEPNIPQEQYLPVSAFLSKPYAYEYIRGIDIERYDTKGELLRAVLTFLRFTPRYTEPNVKEALMKILPSINLSGAGKLLVDRRVECSPLASVYSMKSININDLLPAITRQKLNNKIRDSFNIVIGYITSPKFDLSEYVMWIDMDQPITKGELLKLIFLKILDKNPTIGKHVLQLLSQIQENEGIGKEIYSFQIKKHKKMSLPIEIDLPELVDVIKSGAPQNSVKSVFNLLRKQNVYDYLEGFDASKYESKGKLLLGVLTFLQTKYDASTELGKAVLELIPYVDLEHAGALPPTIKKVYITTNTSVNVFTLDLGTLYTIIPRNNLTSQGRAALDAIFKYLSTEDVDYMDLLQGISKNLPIQLKLKMILNKLMVIGEDTIKTQVEVLLSEIEENLLYDSYQYRETIPDMDWIEVLRAIPDSGVPTEVIEGKKELYYFFLSSAFKTAIHDFRINLNYNRAKFLKVLLAYLRTKSDVIKIKTVKNAIAYVYMFIKEEGNGLESVHDDIILPEQQEEAMSAKNRIKELLYQVLGLIEQEGAFEILQTLQKLFDSSTNLNLETTYLGYDVLEEFPPKERLVIILRRIYHNFIMFLDQDTISAIDMVFISLGETKEQTSQSLRFLPMKIGELMETVLGQSIPANVTAAKEIIINNIDLPTLPLGKSFQDTVPSILNLEPRPRLAVVLRILWRIYLKEKDTELLKAIKSIYEYIQPHSLESEILTQEHHTAIVAALTGLIRPNAPPSVLDAKHTVIEQLKKQKNIYDKSLASFAIKSLSPIELVAGALRRFREHQHKLQPKLWTAISTIFQYLSIPEYDYSGDEIGERINIIDEFKFLTEEAGNEVASSKRLLLTFLVDNKQDISKIFRGKKVLQQYSPKDKMAIILTRLLRIYGEQLEPKVFNAVEEILKRLNDTTIPREVDEEQIDVFQLLDTVIDRRAPERVIAAKNLLKNTLQENPSMIQSTLQDVIIQEDYNEQRRLAIIIRSLYKKFKLELNKEIIKSLMTIFDYLNVSPETYIDDQFAGNVTFEPMFRKVFPDGEIPNHIALAVNKTLNVLNTQVDIKHILHGINLWKLPLEKQASLILYRLSKHGSNLTKDVKDAVNLLLDGLDTSIEELAAEDIDESYTPEKLFREVFKNVTLPAEVQEAKGIIMHMLLSESPIVKDIYRGIDFANISSPIDRLVAVLKNIHIKQEYFGTKMSQALQVLSTFLDVKLGDIHIDPYTFDFASVFDRIILSSAPQSVQQAKKILLSSIKSRPSFFKKILKHVNIEDYERDKQLIGKILNAILDYKNQTIKDRVKTATNHLSKFLQGDPIDYEESQLVMKYYNENEDDEEDGDSDDEIGVRMFQDDTSNKNNNKHWKRKKSKHI
ncbi:hypothetical protein L9F63_006926 [Diploptera punctata]|uniref:Uncharacterized protein n=1 Tax=Diploptera punctata TaxID=6984 RepID=A0AAD8E3R7_DIPPU|nr:hypothetical protein L9F63_006926 [Diploptera punctata]